MKRVLVSILSDNIIPNFLLIKEFDGQYDSLLFITTQGTRSKNKGLFLERALGIPDYQTNRIEIIEDNYQQILTRFEQSTIISADDEYVVNLTGGTKIMSIAVRDYFSRFTSCFYYIPIGKNQVRNLSDENVLKLRYRINLNEYLTIHGFSYSPQKVNLVYPQSKAADVFLKCRMKNFSVFKVGIIADAKTLPDNIDKEYYSGKWFEEYTYYRLKEELELPDDAIATGIKINHPDSMHISDNELDVVFVYENELYVVECKVSMIGPRFLNGKASVKDTTEKYLYKLAAISKDYGLRVNAYLMTLQNLDNATVISPQSKSLIEERARLLGIKGLIDCNTFKKFSPLIKKKS